MPDFEDTNKKEWMKLFRRKEIFNQAVIEIMEGGNRCTLEYCICDRLKWCFSKTNGIIRDGIMAR